MGNANANNLIPFGKYKGQPIEVLSQDKQYLEWLQQQDWFKSRYATINTLIVNNFQEPSETPEHNKIQALFTDDEFCTKFYYSLVKKHHFDTKKGFETWVYLHPETRKYYKKNQHGSHLASLDGIHDWYKEDWYYNKGTEKIYLKKEEIIIPAKDTKLSFEIEYEKKGVDVEIEVEEMVDEYILSDGSDYFEYRSLGKKLVEIKPSLSDDYPATLRQMKNNKSTILLTEKFTATGATLEQVRQIFRSSSIYIFLLSDINSIII